jgi:electron transfer flavoprotein alpha subunit
VKLGAAFISGTHTLPTAGGTGLQVKRVVYSNKGIQTLSTGAQTVVYTVKPNAFQPEESAAAGAVTAVGLGATATNNYKVLATKKFSDEVSLTEADVVVSAGRGMKGPENWGVIEELAKLLGAATACSKPVSDIHWRPHHEHVGQTGIQIAPNVYIAVGISGAIQHLAGVSASKTIIVINKDPEAPFFKAADFGVVADAFDVMPKLVEAVKAYKASH